MKQTQRFQSILLAIVLACIGITVVLSLVAIWGADEFSAPFRSRVVFSAMIVGLGSLLGMSAIRIHSDTPGVR